ncbi:MAG: 3'(2'),5'-bisphosphate nucleotidase CysQ [Pseudomonadota bacterium]
MAASDLALLTEAARTAGKIASDHWRKDPEVWQKSDGAGPVTEADLAVDAHLHNFLVQARPDHGWLSEETPDNPDRLSKRRVFVVDPIDGTRAFAAGERTWAVSIAIVEDGQPVAGVVYLPIREKLYAATRGGAATLNGQEIRVSQGATAEGAKVLATRPSLDPAHWRDGKPPGIERHFRTSLAYRITLVAEGRFDAMMTLRDAWEWDIAAGALIAASASGTVTDRYGGDLRFNAPVPKTRGIIAANATLQASLRDLLA